MAQRYPASWKNCATCVYWMGQRDTNYFGEWVQVDSSSTKAECRCMQSPWRRQQRIASNSCVKYEKWPVLKK